MDVLISSVLRENDEDNNIFFGLTSEELQEICDTLYLKKISKKTKSVNNFFLDFVLDFNDLPLLDNIVLNTDSVYSKEFIHQRLYKSYLTYKIFQQIQQKNLKSNNYWLYYEYQDYNKTLNSDPDDFMEKSQKSFNSMLAYLSLLGRENDSKVRIHLFLDKVEDPSLQEVINLIIESKQLLINGYTSKMNLITLSKPDGEDLSKNAFRGFYKEATYKKIPQKNH